MKRLEMLMEKREAFVIGLAATLVAGVLLGISGFIYLNAQENRSKDKVMFKQCMESHGTFFKTERGPICIK